jgi:hypothetical protein
MIPQKPPLLGFLRKLLGLKKGTDARCVLCKTGRCPSFSTGSDAPSDSGIVKTL